MKIINVISEKSYNWTGEANDSLLGLWSTSIGIDIMVLKIQIYPCCVNMVFFQCRYVFHSVTSDYKNKDKCNCLCSVYVFKS